MVIRPYKDRDLSLEDKLWKINYKKNKVKPQRLSNVVVFVKKAKYYVLSEGVSL